MIKVERQELKRLDDYISELAMIKCNLLMVACGIEGYGKDTCRYAVEAPANRIGSIVGEMSEIVELLLRENDESEEETEEL